MGKNIGLIGAGYWGKNHLRVLNELGVLGVVCDCDESKKCSGVDFVSQTSQVFNNPEIEAVVIATPAGTHYKIVKEALSAGKHVLVEKPLALEVEQGKELVDLAKKNNLVLMVGHLLYYHPGIARLKELIKSGELGDIRYIWSNRLNFGKMRQEENVLWSFAPHDISLIIDILGMPQKVFSMGRAYLKENIPDTTLSFLEYDNNLAAHIFVSWLNPFKEQKFSVIGSQKMAVFDGVKNELAVYSHEINYKEDKSYEAIKKEKELVSFEDKEPLTEEIKHFLECVKENKTPKTDGEEGLRVLRVLDMCQKSLLIKK